MEKEGVDVELHRPVGIGGDLWTLTGSGLPPSARPPGSAGDLAEKTLELFEIAERDHDPPGPLAVGMDDDFRA